MKTSSNIISFFLGSILTFAAYAQSNSNKTADDAALIKSFIKSRGYDIPIVFSADNIKQFWIDNSVMAKNDSINVFLTNDKANESNPFKIQLANVDLAQNCKIEILSEENDLSFSVTDNKSNILASSTSGETFIQYKISSAEYSLEQTKDLAFYLVFMSKQTKDILSIKKILLSFSQNNNFISTKKDIIITNKDIETASIISPKSQNSFSVTGKQSVVFSKKKIILNQNAINKSITIKNIGETSTNVFVGYQTFSKKGEKLDYKNNIYNNENNILKVVSFEKDNKSIVVDALPKWEKNCVLVINAEEDISDFPNSSFVGGKILDVKESKNGNYEIFFADSISQAIKTGTTVRIQSKQGETYMYTNNKRLQPGEEVTFQAHNILDNNMLKFARTNFCKGTYYVQPVLVSLSVNPGEHNTILVTDWHETISE